MFRAKRPSQKLHFPKSKGRKVEASFSGGDITSDAGSLLLRAADKAMALTDQLAPLFPDSRNPLYVTHSINTMLKQRLYGLALGYEDLNDHDALRGDIALQTATDNSQKLASSSTLCRLENTASREMAVAMSRQLVELFIQSHKTPPQELILDFDATDDKVHGKQENVFYHGYYRHECFLPLYVTCGSHLLVRYLRPSSNNDQALHAWSILALLVKRLRQAWPEVKITFRADSGFCRHRLFDWCERNQVGYVVGIGGNSRLKKLAERFVTAAKKSFDDAQTKQRLFTHFDYKARSWSRKRRIILKAEHTAKGSNPRFVVTNLKDDAQAIYDDHYCLRGDMENRIKEQQLELFSDRTSAHAWWTNQLRLLFSTFAYCLLNYIRRTLLAGTVLARAQCGTIRLKLLKIGAVVLRNTRRIQFLLSSSCPYQELFARVAGKLLCPG